MSFSQIDRMLALAAEARRLHGSGGARHGYVKEVKEAGGERKMRCVIGIRPDGSELLTPWLHADDHSGGGREQQLYEKGQNVTVNCQGGDFRQANVSPGPQSNSFPQPDHAQKINGDTYQAGKVRRSVNKPSSDQGGGASGGSSASLSGTTEVQTPNGIKNIQQLQLGDKVFSYNTNTKKPEEDTVVGVHIEITEKKMLQLSYHGGSIHCTEDHLIWSEQRQQYVQANSLYFNEMLRIQENVAPAVTVKEMPVLPDTRVYHLTIKKNHNFFVREAGSEKMLLVHNQNAGSGGGSSNKGGDKHFHDVWIAEQDNKKPQHQDQPNAPIGQSSGGGAGASQQSSQQQQQDKAAMRSIVHEQDGVQHIVGTDHRVVAHTKGAKVKSGDENWCVASKEEKKVIVRSEEPPWVSDPWIIKKKQDPIPDFKES